MTERIREGFRRLSIVVGNVAALVWLVWLFALYKSGGVSSGNGWLPFVYWFGGAVLSFFAAWALVRGIGWVVRAFKE